MARGFGVTQPKRRSLKKFVESKAPTSNMHRDDAPTKIQICLENDWRVNLEKQALAWRAGGHNPLADLDSEQVRPLDADEEEWLFLARTIGWLQVDDELDAIYFTAPPPTFDETQANWYLRPDLTTCIEEPVLLQEAMVSHPIPCKLAMKAIASHTKRLRWKSGRIEAFIQDVADKPRSELTNEDFTAILLELQHL